MKKATFLLAVTVLAAGLLGGCTKFTRQNYEMIQPGDTTMHVERVLGEPEYRHSELWTYIHRNPYYQAKIYFQDNKVAKKEWFDEKNQWNEPKMP